MTGTMYICAHAHCFLSPLGIVSVVIALGLLKLSVDPA